MIGRDYCVAMAHYNMWQNNQLIEGLKGVDEDALREDQGAFFGSILGTLSHLMWGDALWMSRFDGGVAPEGGFKASMALAPDVASWQAARVPLDDRIIRWAERIAKDALTGDLNWYSGAAGREMSKPMAVCVVGFFNHQTHHRGQVHAMMTRIGLKAPVSDLIFMPIKE